jgi:pimeloyl-ACP methyl ester carboxylesterase
MDTIKHYLTNQINSLEAARKLSSSFNVTLTALCLFLLNSCATPSEHFADAALAVGFTGFSIHAGQFEHRMFINNRALLHLHDEVVHVYLDGDGTPWEQNRWIADDPTSRNPMILELMQQDKHPAIFLGRPCYHGFNKSRVCYNKYWTSHRYGREVIDSMVLALKHWLKQNPYQQIVLIGFSGGGTLAVLMAPNVPGIQEVVTLAANLDIDAWSAYHHYLPLNESMNPAKLKLNGGFKQLHLAGLEDTVVPANLIKRFADMQPNASFIAYPHFDHHCCWVKEWPIILSLF